MQLSPQTPTSSFHTEKQDLKISSKSIHAVIKDLYALIEPILKVRVELLMEKLKLLFVSVTLTES